MLKIIAMAAAALASAACASTVDTAAPAGRDCFSSSQINGYDVIDDHHVSINTGASRRYILTTDWNARDLDWSHAIAIRSSSDWICTGNGLGVDIIGGEPQRTYPVSMIEKAPEPAPQGS